MPTPNDDPLLVSARREAIIVALVWLAAAVYSLTYCGLYGYGRSLDDLTFVLGFPDWVFWGLFLPWGIATVVSCIIALFVIRDEPLEGDPE